MNILIIELPSQLNHLILQKNQQRGREGKAPVTITECMDIATKVLAANKLAHWSNFYAGDPYIGDREEEMKAKNKRINELEEENSRLRKQLELR